MANPNPRTIVSKCYAFSAYVGDIIALNGVEEADKFLYGMADLIRDAFPDNMIAATLYQRGARIIFVFKSLEAAQQVERDWSKAVAFLEKSKQG